MRNQRLTALILQEFRTIIRLPVFWILVVVLGLLTFSLTPAVFVPSSRPGATDVSVFINSRYALIQFFAFSSLLGYPFFVSILAGMSVVRDEELNVGPIIHSTRLSAGEYILGKYLGVLLAIGLAIFVHMIFAMLRYEVLFAGATNMAAGPFSLANYLFAVFVFTVPGILLYTGITFAVGACTRKSMLVYVTPVVLFMTTMNFAFAGSEGGASPMIVLLDSSGLHWLLNSLFAVDRGVAFYNDGAFEWEAIFALNRLLICLVAGLALFGSMVYFKRSRGRKTVIRTKKRRKEKSIQATQALSKVESAEKSIRGLSMSSLVVPVWQNVWHVFWNELRAMYRQPVYYLFMLFTLGMIGETARASSNSILGTSSYLTAGGIAVSVQEMLSFLCCLLLLFYVVEALHRDKVTGAAQIVYATQVKTVTLLLARVAAGVVLFGVVIAVLSLFSLSMLAAQGIQFVEVKPFLVIWAGLMGITMLLWVAFLIATHTVVRSRYTTYAVGLVVLGISAYLHTQGKFTWATNWDLWGVLRWSDMGTFDLHQDALILNRSWVLGLAVFFFVFAVFRFERTTPDGQRHGILNQLARHKFRWATLAVLGVLPIALMGYTSQQVEAGFQGNEAEEKAMAYWRQNVSTWRDFEPASVKSMEMDVDLQPVDRRFTMQGTYQMINESTLPMYALPFTMGQSFQEASWWIDGQVTPFEDRSGLHVLQLDHTLMPGDSVNVRFKYHATYPRGFTRNGGGIAQFVLPAGVSLSSMRGEFLPVPGFLERQGVLQDNYYQPAMMDSALVHLAARPQIQHWSDFDSKISVTVPPGYKATATGTQTDRFSTEEGTTYVWETQYPVQVVNIMAGQWEVKRERNNELYYHPTHTHNIDELMDAMTAARDQYSEWFYPYPWSSLKISEFPNMEMNATAYPTNIAFSESIGFMTKPERDAHLPFVVTAHEVAHQWWGHLLKPAEGPGADVLIEGMANYATLLLMQSEKGPDALKEYLLFLERQYVLNRRPDTEVPVLANRAFDRASEAVAYNKTPWIMWMLQQHLGRAQMLRGIRSFMAQYVPATSEQPRLPDLIASLRSKSNNEEVFDDLIDVWFAQAVLPEFRILDATLSPHGDAWKIQAEVVNDGSGSVWVELGALRGEDEAGNPIESKIELLMLQPGTTHDVELITDFEPDRLAFDPFVKVLQLNRDRNAVTLSVQ